MGEYGDVIGGPRNIKLGTCENMYYLRADQRSRITGYRFALDVERFRFPFPDEDGIAPGAFEAFDRNARIPGDWTPPAEWDHDGSVQFQAHPGYLLSLPCPESAAFAETGIRVHRNGWSGGYGVVQTAFRDGEWRIIVVCRSCGHRWNLPLEQAQRVADAFREDAARTEWRAVWRQDEAGEYVRTGEMGFEPVHSADTRRELETIADRILAGYALTGVTS